MTPTAKTALTNAPKSTCRSETMKRVLMGSSNRKSILPVRTSSERLVQFTRKNAWYTCWMKLLAPTSSTICHCVQVPTELVCEKTTLTKHNCKPNQSSSTTIHKMKLPLNDISRATEFFHRAA